VVQLKPFQEEGVKLITGFGGRALVADEMGLGKTAQALVYLGRAGALPFCVVCEASTKTNWEREVAMWLGKRATILNGQKPPSDAVLGGTSPAYIINYTILPQWVDWLRAQGVKHFILDECHNLTSAVSDRTHAVRDVVKGCHSLIALSGTPMTNRPIDMWPVLSMLRPDIWGNQFQYMQRYCKPVMTPRGWEAKGATNLDELFRSLKTHCMIRRMKAEVLQDFPAKTRLTIPLPLMDQDIYTAASRDLMKWLKQYGRGGQTTKAKGREDLYRVGELVRLASRLKLRAAVAWVNQWLEENHKEKLVLFTVNQPAWEVYMRRLHHAPVGINGATPPKARQALVDKFQRDEGCRVLVGNLLAAGVGLNMTAACHTVHAELWWAPYRHTQGEDRVHRIGQTRPCWAYYLVAMGTIEERIASALRSKQEIQDKSLDGFAGKSEVNLFENVLAQAVVHAEHLVQRTTLT
jgi:SNF2 family DNA or RNA helicase